MNPLPHIQSLHVYPVKSCAGFSPPVVQLNATGLAHDREWMVIDPAGRFLTQRDEPRLALIAAAIRDDLLWLSAAGITEITLPLGHEGPLREVGVWRSQVSAFDAGPEAAEFFSAWLRRPARLVRFDARHPRLSNRDWTGEVRAPNLFSDGYPLMVLSAASLEDLNQRLGRALPMDRFRPNIVLGGVAPYAEDVIREIDAGEVSLRLVKPCTRCVITTTDQATGERDGEEPLRTLKSYRYDRGLRGVIFGQNAVILRGGDGSLLQREQVVSVRYGRSDFPAISKTCACLPRRIFVAISDHAGKSEVP